MTLSLTSPGRAFDDFNRANGAIGANWTKEYAAGGDLSIAGNKAVSSAQDNVWSFNPFGSANTDQFVSMVVYSSVNYSYKCLARCGGTNGVGAGYQVLLSGLGSLSVWNLAAGTQMGSTQTVSSVTSIGIRVTGSGATTKVSAFYNGSIHASLTDLTAATYTNAGKAGAYTVVANSSIDNFESLSRANVLVTSLPTGYYARLTDGTNVVDAAESSGTATITPSTAQGFGPWTLRIYNGNPTGAGVQQGSDQTGVYGGDSWAGSGFVTTQALAGSASGLGALTAVLALLQPLTGVSTGTGTEAATLAQLVALAANARGVATTTAVEGAYTALGNAAALGSATATATLTQLAPLAAQATGYGSTLATLAEIQQMQDAAANGDGNAQATLTQLQHLVAAAVGISTVSVHTTGLAPLSAAAIGDATASAMLTQIVSLAAAATGADEVTADLALMLARSASAIGTGQAHADLGGMESLGAALAVGNGGAEATLARIVALAANACGLAYMTAELTTRVSTAARYAAHLRCGHTTARLHYSADTTATMRVEGDNVRFTLEAE